MASQTRAIAGNASTPWWEGLGFTGPIAPLPNLWTLDAVYDAQNVATFDYSESTYTVNPLTAFSSIGSATVTSISLTLQQCYADLGLTSMDTWMYIGAGVGSGSYMTSYDQGGYTALALNTTPQDRTITWTPTGLALSFIKTNMTSTNFGVQLKMTTVFSLFNLYTDTISITINYTDEPSTDTDSSFHSRGGNRDRLLWGVR